MEWQTPFLILGAQCFAFGIVMWAESARLRRRIREIEEDGWASQVMTWSEYVALPMPLRGCPYWETGGEGPGRKVIVWTQVFIGRPDMKDVR